MKLFISVTDMYPGGSKQFSYLIKGRLSSISISVAHVQFTANNFTFNNFNYFLVKFLMQDFQLGIIPLWY